MLTIRLSRRGMTNLPQYRVVVTEKKSKRDGRVLENVGHFDPKNPQGIGTLKLDRIDHWVSKGAQPSETVAKIIKRIRSPKKSAA
jgi:small subunit ribosomal protein S16